MDTTKKQKLQGIRYILCAAFFFALMNLFVKLAGELPVWQKSFFRNIVAAFVAAAVMLKEKEKPSLNGNKWNFLFLFLRCFIGTIGILCNFYAIGKMNIADASMLNKLSPFFAMIFSIFLLKEKPKKLEWLAVLLAFSGALFVIKPSFQLESVPAFLGLFGGLCAGFAYTCVRKLGQSGVRGNVIVLSFSVFSCLFALPGMYFTYQPMEWKQLVSLLLAGASAAGGQFSITAAYTKAPAKEISVYDYTQVIFAAIISFIVLGDLPDGYSFLGYAIIIGTAVWKWRYSMKGE